MLPFPPHTVCIRVCGASLSRVGFTQELQRADAGSGGVTPGARAGGGCARMVGFCWGVFPLGRQILRLWNDCRVKITTRRCGGSFVGISK